jgi:hypothetical protein
MHKFFNVNHLSEDQRREILLRAKDKCYKWWVDVLDCKKNWCRQQIDMSFEEIMAKFKRGCHFTMIQRQWYSPVAAHEGSFKSTYLEIGFSTFGQPDYYLWMELDSKYIEEFTATL